MVPVVHRAHGAISLHWSLEVGRIRSLLVEQKANRRISRCRSVTTYFTLVAIVVVVVVVVVRLVWNTRENTACADPTSMVASPAIYLNGPPAHVGFVQPEKIVTAKDSYASGVLPAGTCIANAMWKFAPQLTQYLPLNVFRARVFKPNYVLLAALLSAFTIATLWSV